MVLKKNLISNNSKFFLLSLFFFFNSSIYSKSLDDFLNWNFLISLGSLDCPAVEKSFSEVNRKNQTIDFKKNYQLTKDIIEKNCTSDLETKIALDENIQGKFSLFSVSKSEKLGMNFDQYFGMTSELDLKVYIFYLKNILSPHLEKNDIKKITFLYEKTRNDLFDLHKNKVLEDLTFISIFFNLARDFYLQVRWELYSKALKDLEDYLVDFISFEIRKGAEGTKLQNFNTLASDLMYLRFERLLALAANQNNEELLISIKQIIDLYLYEENTDLKAINYQEFLDTFIERDYPGITTTQISISFRRLEDIAAAFISFANNGDDIPYREFSKFKGIALNHIDNNPKIEEGYVFVLNAIGVVDSFLNDNQNFGNLERSDNCISFRKIKINETYLENIDSLEFRSLGGMELSCDIDKGIAFNKSLNKKFGLNKTGNVHLFLASLNNLNTSRIYKLFDKETNMVENFEEGIKFAEAHFYKTTKLLELLDDATLIKNYEDMALLGATYQALNPWGSGRYLSLSQRKSLEALIQKKLFFNQEIFIKNIESAKNYSSLKFMAIHISLFINAYLQNTLSYSLYEDNFLNLTDLDSFHNLHTRYALLAFKPLDDDQKQNLYNLIMGVISIYSLLEKMDELNPKKTTELSWAFNNKAPEILNSFFKNEDQRNLRLWTHFLGTLMYLPELQNDNEIKKPSTLVKSEENAMLNVFSLENASPITYAYLVQSLKEKFKKKNKNFKKLIEDYYEAILSYSEFKESLINFKSTSPGVSSMETSVANTRLSSKVAAAKKAASLLVNFKDMDNNFVFKYSDFNLSPIKVEDIQKILKENEILFQPVRSNTAPGINQFISKNNSWFKVGYVGYQTDNLIKDINTSLKFNSKNKLKDFDLESSALLYEELLGDLDNFISKDNKKIKVYVVISESFKELPFSLLYDKKRNKYAFENFEFIYLDSAHSLRYLEDKAPRKINESLKYLAFADPKLEGNSRDTNFKNLFTKIRSDNGLIKELARIPETASEVKDISKNFKRAKVFLQEDASEQRLKSKELKQDLQEADIVSFATHTFSDVSNYTTEHGLVLSPPEKISGENDGFLSSKEITKLELNGGLVVLSACDTNQPIYLNAPPFSGLTKSFIQAGARSVLFTNWNIDSLSAKIFMTNTFQTGLDKNSTISEAISLTMQKFADGHFGDEYKHPFYWAPYQLLGDF